MEVQENKGGDAQGFVCRRLQRPEKYKDVTKVAFGIGTFVTNDTMVEPLNIVIKLQYVNGRPVAKLSDCEAKAMCDDENYLKYLKASVKFRLEREDGNEKI